MVTRKCQGGLWIACWGCLMPKPYLPPRVAEEIESLGSKNMAVARFVMTEIGRVGVACSRVNACVRLINSLMARDMSLCATVHGLCGGDDMAIKARAAKLHEIFPELVLTQVEVGE